jgi:hypothetical protein
MGRWDGAAFRVFAEADRCPAADTDSQAFVSRIYEHDSGHVVRIHQGEVPYDGAAEGVADQQVRALLFQFRQRIVQFKIQLRERSRLGTGIAPGVSGPVVGANARETGNFPLHQNPVKGKISEPVLDNDRGGALPGAVDMQFVAAEVNEFSGRFRGGRRRPRGNRKDETDNT